MKNEQGPSYLQFSPDQLLPCNEDEIIQCSSQELSLPPFGNVQLLGLKIPEFSSQSLAGIIDLGTGQLETRQPHELVNKNLLKLQLRLVPSEEFDRHTYRLFCNLFTPQSSPDEPFLKGDFKNVQGIPDFGVSTWYFPYSPIQYHLFVPWEAEYIRKLAFSIQAQPLRPSFETHVIL